MTIKNIPSLQKSGDYFRMKDEWKVQMRLLVKSDIGYAGVKFS